MDKVKDFVSEQILGWLLERRFRKIFIFPILLMLFVFTSLEAVCRSIFGKPVSSNLSSLIGLAGWLIAAMVYAFLVYYVRNQRLNLNKIKILAIAFTPIPPENTLWHSYWWRFKDLLMKRFTQLKDIELVFTDAPMGTFSSLEKARLRAIDYGAQIFIWGRIIKDPPGVAFNPIIQSTVNDIVSFDVKYPDLREFQHEEEAFAKAFDNISNGLADALLFGIGLTFHELGKYESSIDCLQRFSSEKNNPTALYYLANALFSIKKYEEAIRYCDLGIRSWQKDGSKVPKHKYHVLKFTSLIFLWRELEDNSLLERALGELELAEECDDLCPGDKEIFASQKELVMDKKEELDSKGIKSRLI